MPIIHVKTETGHAADCRYKPPSDEYIGEKVKAWLDIFAKFSIVKGIKESDLDVDTDSLVEMIVRIDRRKEYYKIYHDGTVMNELKIVALAVYWILRFKPFFYKKNHYINEDFCYFVICGTCKDIHEVYGKEFYLSHVYRNQLQYSLSFWELSQDALMKTLGSLCPFVEEESPPAKAEKDQGN